MADSVCTPSICLQVLKEADMMVEEEEGEGEASGAMGVVADKLTDTEHNQGMNMSALDECTVKQ